MHARTETATIRVGIFDTEPLMRRGIRAVLERTNICSVIWESSKIEDIFDLLHDESLDVAIIHTEVFSEQHTMRHIMERIRACIPRFPTILMASYAEQGSFFRAIHSGMCAYETRDIGAERLVEVVVAVSRGEYLFDEAVLFTKHDLIHKNGQVELEEEVLPTVETNVLLSDRELEILSLIASGNSNKEISRLLGISDQTVKNHITSILKKTEVNDRTAAVVFALRKGWIKIQELQRVPA